MEASDTQTPEQVPQVPHVDHAPMTPEEVTELAEMMATYRAEVADLRAERALRRAPTVINVPQESLADRQAARLAAIAQKQYYCPGCGALYSYPQKCTGPEGGLPHAPIEVVTTDELSGDPLNHTAAPSTE